MSEASKKSEVGLEDVLRRLIREELTAVLGYKLRNGDGDTLLTCKQAAKLMACSPDYLYRRSSKFPFTRKIGRMLRFSEKELLAFVEAKRRAN